MHVRRLTIENIRSIRQLDIDLRGEERPAGWHVLLGDNGTGKSTVVRALALALMGESNAHATREDWSRWLATGCESGRIAVDLSAHGLDEWADGERVDKVPIKAIASIVAQTGRRRQNGHQANMEFSGGPLSMEAFGEAVKGGSPPLSDPSGASPAATVRWTGSF